MRLGFLRESNWQNTKGWSRRVDNKERRREEGGWENEKKYGVLNLIGWGMGKENRLRWLACKCDIWLQNEMLCKHERKGE